jgi:hypothetical protein
MSRGRSRARLIYFSQSGKAGPVEDPAVLTTPDLSVRRYAIWTSRNTSSRYECRGCPRAGLSSRSKLFTSGLWGRGFGARGCIARKKLEQLTSRISLPRLTPGGHELPRDLDRFFRNIARRAHRFVPGGPKLGRSDWNSETSARHSGQNKA